MPFTKPHPPCLTLGRRPHAWDSMDEDLIMRVVNGKHMSFLILECARNRTQSRLTADLSVSESPQTSRCKYSEYVDTLVRLIRVGGRPRRECRKDGGDGTARRRRLHQCPTELRTKKSPLLLDAQSAPAEVGTNPVRRPDHHRSGLAPMTRWRWRRTGSRTFGGTDLGGHGGAMIR